MAKKPTLRDIAKQADVAVSTVSQVINNKSGVSSKMRQRVLAAAEALGYQQKVIVETPISPEMKTIGLLTKRENGTPLSINPFYSYILAGAEAECQQANIDMMYASIEVDENNHATSLPSMLLDERLDGVIVVGAFLEETISDISQRVRQNVVLVDSYTTEGMGFDSVLIDNQRSAEDAVAYLIEKGHKHIGLVGSHPASYPSIYERRAGYLSAIRKYNINQTYIEDGLLRDPQAYEDTQNLMRRTPEITAIFACNDNVAIAAISALRDMGLTVPGDVSVVGFDDIDAASQIAPSLTTIHVDKVLMGAIAVRQLRERALDPNRTPITVTVSTQLVERDSVRRID